MLPTAMTRCTSTLEFALAVPLTVMMLASCDPPAAPIAPTPIAPVTPVAPTPIASAEPAKPADVKEMKEYWEGTKFLKYYNEMRKDEQGKWQKTGLGRAYYSDGVLEREGMYKNGTRVGIWKYFGDKGELSRTEDRGSGLPGGAQ